MASSFLSDGSAIRNLMPLFGVIAFIAGGLIMITSASTRIRAEQLSRRVASVQPRGGAVARGTGLDEPQDGQRSAAAYGLSETQHRQIVRSLASFGASADSALLYFTAMRLSLALVLGAIIFLAAPLSSLLLSILASLAGAAFGWFLPLMIVNRKLKRHAKAVGSGLPGGLELLAICVEAGLSLETGLQRVARELKGAQPALADELALTWAEISILPSRDQALANLAERVNLPSVRSVVGTLAQSMRYGSPLAQSLRNAAEEMRGEQLLQLEERANRLPALMTVPVMLFIMPTIFLIVGGPAVLRLMDIFGSGK